MHGFPSYSRKNPVHTCRMQMAGLNRVSRAIHSKFRPNLEIFLCVWLFQKIGHLFLLLSRTYGPTTCEFWWTLSIRPFHHCDNTQSPVFLLFRSFFLRNIGYLETTEKKKNVPALILLFRSCMFYASFVFVPNCRQTQFIPEATSSDRFKTMSLLKSKPWICPIKTVNLLKSKPWDCSICYKQMNRAGRVNKFV